MFGSNRAADFSDCFSVMSEDRMWCLPSLVINHGLLCKSLIPVFFLKADVFLFLCVFRSEEGSSQIFLPFVCVSIKVIESSPRFTYKRKFVGLTMFAAV